MPAQHTEQLRRLSFRIDTPTQERLDRIAKVLATRGGAAKPSRTAAIRFAAQIAEAFDVSTYDDVHKIVSRLQTGPDRSGTVAFAEAIKFAVRVAAAATASTPPAKR